MAEPDSGMKSSTIKNHISSLNNFAKYLFSREVSPKFGESEFKRFTIRKDQWFRALKPQGLQEAVEMRSRSEEEAVFPLDFQNYLASAKGKAALKVLRKSKQIPGFVGKRDFTLMRDYLVTFLSFINGCRASGIDGLTRAVFKKAVFYECSNNYSMEVTMTLQLFLAVSFTKYIIVTLNFFGKCNFNF